MKENTSQELEDEGVQATIDDSVDTEQFRDYLAQSKDLLDVSMADFIGKCADIIRSKRSINETKMLLISAKSFLHNYIGQIQMFLATPLDFASVGKSREELAELSKERQTHFDNIINSHVIIERIDSRMAVLEVLESGHSVMMNAPKQPDFSKVELKEL